MAAMRPATLLSFWPELPRFPARWKKPGSALKKLSSPCMTQGCWPGAISIWVEYLIFSRTVTLPWGIIVRRWQRAIQRLIPGLRQKEVWRPHTRGETQRNEEVFDV